MKNKMDKKKIVEAVIFVVVSLLLIFLIPRFVIERVDVKGPSMNNTLYNKDALLVEKVTRYFGAIDRFDIIVFYPDEQTKKKNGDYNVKRVIGLPGETVQIVGQTILINGEPLEESYGSTEMDAEDVGIAAQPVLLGKDEYFVLGDNREVSLDSRRNGPVPLSRIEGKVLLRIFPFKRFGTVN